MPTDANLQAMQQMVNVSTARAFAEEAIAKLLLEKDGSRQSTKLHNSNHAELTALDRHHRPTKR
jgi:hypothetical protein